MENARLRQDLGIEEIDGELLILDKANNKIHKLNASARFIWQRIQAGKSESAIASELSKVARVSDRFVARDIKKLISKFRELGLVISESS
jgi:hypothetical protein